MKRREFFRALFALPVAAASSAVAAALPKPALRSGRIGRIEGFTFYESAWARSMVYANGRGLLNGNYKGFLRG